MVFAEVVNDSSETMEASYGRGQSRRRNPVLLDLAKRVRDRQPMCDVASAGPRTLLDVGYRAACRYAKEGRCRIGGALEAHATQEVADYLANEVSLRRSQSRHSGRAAACCSCTQIQRAFDLAVLGLAQKPEGRQRLSRATAVLPPRVREVMALYYRDRLTYAEIARVMNITQSEACCIKREGMFMLIPKLRPISGTPRCPSSSANPIRRTGGSTFARRLTGLAGLVVLSVSVVVVVANILRF